MQLGFWKACRILGRTVRTQTLNAKASCCPCTKAEVLPPVECWGGSARTVYSGRCEGWRTIGTRAGSITSRFRKQSQEPLIGSSLFALHQHSQASLALH